MSEPCRLRRGEGYGARDDESRTPPRRAHDTLQTQDESIIVGYYTSAEVHPQKATRISTALVGRERSFMARGDGIHRTSARNMRLTTPKLKNAQQHNEREKESYVNQDIVPERSHLNVHFKQPDNGYLEQFEQMEADGIISTRGIKEDAFRYGKLVLATTTYNADVFPFMKEFIHHLTERNFQNRTIGLMENGSWAPLAAKTMRKMLEGSKNLTFTDTTVKILSALNDDSKAQIESMANELCQDYLARQDETANKNNLDALSNIGYGLYVVTSSDGSKDNGLIVNTVSQVTNTPNRIAVTINKQNYSHHVIKQTGVMNVCCLDTSAPFSVFQTFGFQSGRTADKFAGVEELRSDNGLRFLPRYINSFMSLKVESYVDLDTHGMFICSVTEARVISDRETMTYTYYQNNVKPKPETEGKHGFVCKVCGWVYEGDTLPDDIVCPLCKHGAADFEPIG